MCYSPLFNRVAGQVEVPAGQVNFKENSPMSIIHQMHNVYATCEYTLCEENVCIKHGNDAWQSGK